MSSPQRGRKRGPYKPRQPKAPVVVETPPKIEPAWSEPETDQLLSEMHQRLLEDERAQIHIERAPMRIVRFRYAWNDGDTCPALMWDGRLAVLMPPYASPAAGCSFTFRASTGGFSFAPAIPGAGVGQYTEV